MIMQIKLVDVVVVSILWRKDKKRGQIRLCIHNRAILRLWCSSNSMIDFQGLNYFFIRKNFQMMSSMTVFRHLQNIKLRHLPRCLSDGKRNNLNQKNNIVDLWVQYYKEVHIPKMGFQFKFVGKTISHKPLYNKTNGKIYTKFEVEFNSLVNFSCVDLWFSF